MNKLMPKLWGGYGNKCNKGTQYHQQNRIYDANYIALCLSANECFNPWYMVEEKYYLSQPMKKYINSKDDKYKVGGDNLVINRDIACSKTTREGNTRADTSDYISRELMENANINEQDMSQYRIRKLTPKECWRLMGFSDEDYDKAREVNSESQLYKQAGNSIVVNVLMAIFKEML